MATRRSTFGKQDRERTKRAKAAAKRERRFDKTPDDTETTSAPGGVITDSPDELLREIEALHQRFDAEQISFEDFEEQKIELFERLAALDLP